MLDEQQSGYYNPLAHTYALRTCFSGTLVGVFGLKGDGKATSWTSK